MRKNRLLVLCALSVMTGTEAVAKMQKDMITTASCYTADSRYVITEYGAIGDGKTLNTRFIQAAIDACTQHGGGTLVLSKGIFVSGALFLKRGVNIEFQEGAVLKGSTDINDYPKINTRIEGHFEPWRAALINGDSLEHLHITGSGTLDGSGQPFWLEFYNRRNADNKTTNLNVERPRLTFLQNSTDIHINGITFLNSGFWNLHMYRCRNVAVEYCRFQAPSGPKPYHHAPSSDGIDVDCSQDIAIRHCFFSVGDDCIALKGSKGPLAMQDTGSSPVERIEISDCIFEAGGGIVTFGSEATVVRDVTIQRCTTLGPTVLRLKLRPDTPQQYENITMNDITMTDAHDIFKVSPWTQYFDLKGQQPPKALVQNIKISNVHGTGVSLGEITGHDQAEIKDILLENVDVQFKTTDMRLGNVQNLRFSNVKVNAAILAAPAPGQAAVKSNQ